MPDDWPDPRAAKDVAGFVAAMREVRTRSGLSLRAVERRAARVGDVLPSSTTSAALSRDRLPRAEFVAAFVRACGGGDETVTRWTTARSDLAAGDSPAAPGAGRRRKRNRIAAAAVVLTAAAATVLAVVIPRNAAPATAGASGGVFVHFQLGHTGLCVGEGLLLLAGTSRMVLGQHDCDAAKPPLSLEGSPDGTFRLILHYPSGRQACVTVDADGAGTNLLLADADCADGRTNQRFTIEPVVKPLSGSRIQSVAGARWCIGVKHSSMESGAHLVQDLCHGGKAQTFSITLL